MFVIVMGIGRSLNRFWCTDNIDYIMYQENWSRNDAIAGSLSWFNIRIFEWCQLNYESALCSMHHNRYNDIFFRMHTHLFSAHSVLYNSTICIITKYIFLYKFFNMSSVDAQQHYVFFLSISHGGDWPSFYHCTTLWWCHVTNDVQRPLTGSRS